MDAPITVLVVDDEPFVREGLAEYIASADDLLLAGTCSNGLEAVEAVRANPPDVVLMDLRMPELDGFEATRAISELAPETKVIALTTFADEGDAPNFLECGGAGFLIKSARAPFVINAIRSVHNGVAVLSPETARQLSSRANQARRPALSPREQQVLAALDEGLTNNAIARRLFASASTVKADVASLMQKLGATSRTEIVTKASRLGLLGQPPALGPGR